MPKIHVTDREGGQHEVEATVGGTLMEPLRDTVQGIEALCGGMCSCSTCHVIIDPKWAGKLPAPQSDELELLEGTEAYIEGRSRLACQIPVTADMQDLTLVIAPAE
jgi:ferredoxin, 2Fe-2S